MSKYHRFLLLTIGLIIVSAYIVGGGKKNFSGDRFEIHKGLDLAGGVRVVLQADPASLTSGGHPLSPEEVKQKMDTAVSIIKARVAGIAGVAEPTVSKEGTDRILVELPGVKDEAGALDLIKQTARLDIYYLRNVHSDRNQSARWRMLAGTDKDTGNDYFWFDDLAKLYQHTTITFTCARPVAISPEQIVVLVNQANAAEGKVRNAAKVVGKEVTIDSWYANVQAKGGANAQNPTDAIVKAVTPVLAPFGPDKPNTKTDNIIKTDTPEGMKWFLSEVVGPDTPILRGEDLKPTSEGAIEQGQPVIRFELNPKGTDIFRDFTTAHMGEITAIVLGDQIVTAPSIKNPITDGAGVITGFPKIEEAQAKAMLLNSGALPVTLTIVQKNKVEATLGKEVVSKALFAGLIGLIVVLFFMLIVYRLPGLLADLALAIYALLTLAVFMLVGVTMTLPGLAAFILSIGMAVDANILIFERLKEELRSGKTLHAAIDAGFSRAFTAIFDSNMCTIITALILLRLGTGVVQSFAFTLIIGVLLSMFTAITVTRTFLHLTMNMQWAQNPNLFGLGTSWFVRKNFNIVGRRNIAFALSALVIVPGVIFYFVNQVETGSGLRQGIEFKSGTTMQFDFQQATITYNFAKPVQTKPDQIMDMVRRADTFGTEIPNQVQVAGNTVTIVAPIAADEQAQVKNLGETGPKLIDLVEKQVSGALAAYGPGQPTVKFQEPTTDVNSTDVQNIVTGAVHVKNSAQISKVNGVHVFLRTDKFPDLQTGTKKIADALQAKYGMARYSSNSIDPVISKELTQNAIIAVILAGIVIVFYLAFRFAIGGFMDGLKYGVTAITATFHDVLVITGLFAVLGHFLHWEIDTLFITAVLTMIGFSTHDTIVVFDRIRENLKHRLRGEDFEALANRSILQTFTRSINTSFTVMLTIIALIIFGGGDVSLRQMYIALLAGIISGTYSSIFNATPLLVVWEKVASRGKTAAARRVADDKTMVASNLKPVTPASSGNGRADEDVSSGGDADRVKVKPKTRTTKKRRF